MIAPHIVWKIKADCYRLFMLSKQDQMQYHPKMTELLQAALEPVNLFYTTLLAMVLLYWLSVMLGALDISALDFDLDTADADVDADLHGGGSWLAGVLHFFNFGRLPFMVVMSVVVLAAWCLAILGNYYIGQHTWGFALATFLPIIFASLVLAKLITAPLVPLFAHLDGTVQEVDYIGQVCQIRLPANAEKFGQAEVQIDGDWLLIHVKTETQEMALRSGEQALVVGKTPDGRYYLVRRLEDDKD
ncbi:MAG TPA: DUF1449 family protein [Saprospiraceae bacterium]|mgnify:CR=1 FL=1|nr:DUF1449 family protein [Saprospiraceae bacterium]HMQ85491.1 DUF1449 family protein [Saprospiraceae bacterium]